MIELVNSVANAAVDAELRRLREQVLELQKRCTELVEEKRAIQAELNDMRMATSPYLREVGR